MSYDTKDGKCYIKSVFFMRTIQPSWVVDLMIMTYLINVKKENNIPPPSPPKVSQGKDKKNLSICLHTPNTRKRLENSKTR